MKLTHSQCKALAGDPVVLAASEEQEIRKEWEKRDKVFKAAMRLARYMPPPSQYKGNNGALAKLLRACAKARKK